MERSTDCLMNFEKAHDAHGGFLEGTYNPKKFGSKPEIVFTDRCKIVGCSRACVFSARRMGERVEVEHSYTGSCLDEIVSQN